MLGTLSKAQIEYVLRDQLIGRIGCYADGKIYVIPVTYVYDGTHIYVHSKEGSKVRMMRKNSQVCFQVDVIDNLCNWRSVLVWGEYEELRDEKKQQEALEILNDRLSPLAVSETVRPTQNHDLQMITRGLKPVAYRIKVNEMAGRFEKQ